VGVEDYVPCVVAREVWTDFATEAYRAQAIIARTFVLYQMLHRASRNYDVRATEASQVYMGMAGGRAYERALQAAKYTRGIVCTFNQHGTEEIFATYYSAVCGGASQPAGRLRPADNIPPLAGNVRCDFCSIAPGQTYRWPTVNIPVQEVRKRLIARYQRLAKMNRIVAVEVIERTQSGRPVMLRIIDSSKQKFDVFAEHLRLAVASLGMRSTDCDIRVVNGVRSMSSGGGKMVRLENGKGFGHGLGLCQWGMQGQALKGKKVGEILRYYYPTCHLSRAY